MTKGAEIEHRFENNHAQLNTSQILFDFVYSTPVVDAKTPKATAKELEQVQKEALHIGHGNFYMTDAKQIQKLYDDACAEPGANQASVAKVLRDRANQINEILEKHHSKLRVNFNMGQDRGFDFGLYRFDVVQEDSHGKNHTIAYARFGERDKSPDFLTVKATTDQTKTN